jgi:transcriptional regulator with XRE-family HTH domain
MSSKVEKCATEALPIKTTLPDDIASLFDNTRQATPAELTRLGKAADVLRADPAFLADVSKGLIVEDILRAMETADLNRNTLAAKLGKSRQYVGKILDEEQPANFTIDTLAELSAALGVKLHVRMLPENEHMIFVRGLTVTTKVEPVADFPKPQARSASIFEDCFESSDNIPFPGLSNDPSRMSS